jgi:hypothetical protein
MTDTTNPLDQILEQSPPVTINGQVVEQDLTPIRYQSPRRAGYRGRRPTNSASLSTSEDEPQLRSPSGVYRSAVRSPKEEQDSLETSHDIKTSNSMSQNSAPEQQTHSVPIRGRPDRVRQRMKTWSSPESSQTRHDPSRTETPDLPEQTLSSFSTARNLSSKPSQKDHLPNDHRAQKDNHTIDGSVHSGSSRRPVSLNPVQGASSSDRSALDVELSQRRSASRIGVGTTTTSTRTPRREIQSPFTSARTPEERRNEDSSRLSHSQRSQRDQSTQIRSPFTNKSTRQLAEEREAREIAGDLVESYRSQASQRANDLREQLEESFLNSYREQIARDVADIEAEEANSTERELYPNMPDYDSMSEFEQIQAHAEFENIFESIYTLFPDANRIDTRISLKQKYIIYHAYYRRIQVLQRAEAYMMIMGVAWAVMECFIERFIGNGYFLMQWQKRNKYAIALERLAEMTIPQGDGAMGNPLYEIIWGCGLDLGALVVVNVLHRLFRNRVVAEQIYNILKGFISTAMQKLNAPALLPGAPGEARAAPPPESIRGQQNTNASWVEGTLGAVPGMVQMGRSFLNNLGGNAPAGTTAPTPAASSGQAAYYDN